MIFTYLIDLKTEKVVQAMTVLLPTCYMTLAPCTPYIPLLAVIIKEAPPKGVYPFRKHGGFSPWKKIIIKDQ